MMLRIVLKFLGTFSFFFKVKKKEKLNVFYDGWMKKKLSYIWDTLKDLNSVNIIWREHFNLQREKEKISMVLEKECPLLAAER